MRLEFNVVIIDDDLNDEDKKDDVDEIVAYVKKHVKEKGLKPQISLHASVEKYKEGIQLAASTRYDLILSDNNLGAGQAGINFYTDLADTGIHDFVLYTRDPIDSIIRLLVDKLQESGNPNLFSRFTFVPREANDTWLDAVGEVLDHIISKREEINNLRGLYAQEMSKVENHLRTTVHIGTTATFENLIDKAFEERKIDSELKRFLHTQRVRRNGIIHNDEVFCDNRKAWYVTYETYGRNARTKRVFENDFSRIRLELAQVVDQTMLIP